MKFVKPEMVNDWGMKSVFLGPIVKSVAGTVGLRTQTAPMMHAGKYTVRWPNGTVEEMTVVMKRYWDTVSDMGRKDDVTGELPGLTVIHHDAEFELPVTKAGVEIAIPDDEDFPVGESFSIDLKPDHAEPMMVTVALNELTGVWTIAFPTTTVQSRTRPNLTYIRHAIGMHLAVR